VSIVVESLHCDRSANRFRRESSIRKKRKQRDAILKQQASKKRKRGDLGAGLKEIAAVEISRLGYPSDILQSIDANDQDDNEAKAVPAKAPALKIRSGTTLPEFLPEEYLQDGESDDSLTLDPIQRSMEVQKTKFTGRVKKTPKNYRKGSTTYRVAEVRSTKMAPKSSFNARSVKESWLQGRSGSSRKSFSSGFFNAK
jgi:U3 small nucleolar RNA-associated protein 16